MAAVLIGVTAVCPHGCREPERKTPPELSLWYWHEPFRLQPNDAATLRAMGVHPLFVRAGTITRGEDGALTASLAQVWKPTSPDIALPIHLVFRVEGAVTRILRGPYYKNGTLLLYNAALWNDGHATPEDIAATRAHMYSHETYAQAERLCPEVAKRYPDTPAAPLALYRAACRARKLANFNGWWREDDKLYPRHPLVAEARKYARVFNRERAAWE